MQALGDMQRRLEEEHVLQMSLLIAEQEKEQQRLHQVSTRNTDWDKKMLRAAHYNLSDTTHQYTKRVKRCDWASPVSVWKMNQWAAVPALWASHWPILSL